MENKTTTAKATFFAIAAAALYALSSPFSKMLLEKIPSTLMAGFLYLGAGLGALALGLALGQRCTNWGCMVLALALGFVAYGLSIYFYIYAQRYLGAAKTSTYYEVSPFIGVALSMLVFRQKPSLSFVIALLIMVAGSCLATEKQ